MDKLGKGADLDAVPGWKNLQDDECRYPNPLLS